jgi:hypothetical protein
MSKQIEIANEIFQQIKYFDRMALLAWGGQSFTALKETEENSGGLKFRVKGLVFEGWVVIELRWMDDYTVRFIDSSGAEVKCFKNVYCDMLVEVIDWIEKGKKIAYERK